MDVNIAGDETTAFSVEQLGRISDVACSGKDQLECYCSPITKEMVSWDLAVPGAAKLMVHIAVVGGSTPASGEVELVVHREAKFAEHAEDEGAAVELMARVASSHSNEWVQSLGRDDARKMAEMFVVVDVDPGVEAATSISAAMLADSITGTVGGELKIHGTSTAYQKLSVSILLLHWLPYEADWLPPRPLLSERRQKMIVDADRTA